MVTQLNFEMYEREQEGGRDFLGSGSNHVENGEEKSPCMRLPQSLDR
jgi:hypothetical protein